MDNLLLRKDIIAWMLTYIFSDTAEYQVMYVWCVYELISAKGKSNGRKEDHLQINR